MKLVEILARELGEWPATTACFAQDDGGDIYNYTSTEIVLKDGAWDGDDESLLDDNRDAPGVYEQEMASDYKTAIVTREQWQMEKNKIMSKEWDGEGLPPVGTVCEVYYDDGKQCWHRAVILGPHPEFKTYVAASVEADGRYDKLIWVSGFRTIRTDRDKWAHAAYTCATKKGVVDIKGVATTIYDALASGELDAPKCTG